MYVNPSVCWCSSPNLLLTGCRAARSKERSQRSCTHKVILLTSAGLWRWRILENSQSQKSFLVPKSSQLGECNLSCVGLSSSSKEYCFLSLPMGEVFYALNTVHFRKMCSRCGAKFKLGNEGSTHQMHEILSLQKLPRQLRVSHPHYTEGKGCQLSPKISP